MKILPNNCRRMLPPSDEKKCSAPASIVSVEFRVSEIAHLEENLLNSLNEIYFPALQA